MNTLQDILIKTAAKAQVLEKRQLIGEITESEKKTETVKLIIENYDLLIDLEKERISESGVI